MLAAVSAGEAALWLGIYSTIVSTTVGLLTLYGELFLRLKVGATEDYIVNVTGGGKRLVAAEVVRENMLMSLAVERPVLTIRVRNRGRQPVQIRSVCQAEWFTIDRAVFDASAGSPRTREAARPRRRRPPQPRAADAPSLPAQVRVAWPSVRDCPPDRPVMIRP